MSQIGHKIDGKKKGGLLNRRTILPRTKAILPIYIVYHFVNNLSTAINQEVVKLSKYFGSTNVTSTTTRKPKPQFSHGFTHLPVLKRFLPF